MPTQLNTNLANYMAETMGMIFDDGYIEIYEGTQPSDADDTISDVLLCTINIPSTAFGVGTDGTIDKEGSWVGTVDTTGTAGFFRMYSSDGTLSKDGSITEVGGGGEMEIESVNLQSGESVSVASASITQPRS